MKKIVVAGGGLVGALIALQMKKRGHSVRLLEKRPDLRKTGQHSGRSINLILTSRGLNALAQAGLLQPALALTVPVTGRLIHDKKGGTVAQPYGRDPSECNYSIARSDLNRFLLGACEQAGVEIQFGCEVVAADLRAKKLQITASGQRQDLSYDVLLGTDGAGSVLRQALHQAGVSVEPDQTEYLAVDYKELFLPIGANGGSALTPNLLHIWPRGRHMLMALPNQDGSFTVTLYLPATGMTNSFAALQTPEHIDHFFREEFPDAWPLMPTAGADFLKNPQGKLGTVRSSSWVFEDSLVLLGDAAHAIVPFFGQGMNLGFEDCVYFEKYLDQYPHDWSQAFRAFESFQRPNANAIADMALENFVEMSDRVGDAHFQLMKRVEGQIEKAMPEIYRSRYGLITYTLVPYALAQEAGRIQVDILDQLSQGLKSENDLDLAKAKHLVSERLVPFWQKNHVSVQRYQP